MQAATSLHVAAIASANGLAMLTCTQIGMRIAPAAPDMVPLLKIPRAALPELVHPLTPVPPQRAKEAHILAVLLRYSANAVA